MQITRYTEDTTEIKRQANGKEYIGGYGAVFYNHSPETEYETPDGFIERIDPEAFNDSLLSGQPIESRFNHSREFVLGRSDLGTAQFSVDQKGLRYAVPYDANDPDHQKVRAKIKKGLIKGSSFCGSVSQDDIEIKRSANKTIVTIKKINLKEAGPVDQPAYSGTDAVMRSDLKSFVDCWEEKQKAKEETEKRIARLKELIEEGG